MVHTGEFFFYPNSKEIRDIKLDFTKTCKSENNSLDASKQKKSKRFIYIQECEGTKFTYIMNYNICIIEFDVHELLGKRDIMDTDYEELAIKIQQTIEKYFPCRKLDDIELKRIDFHIDIVTKHKELYLSLLKKVTCKYRHLKRLDYPTSLYFKSKSLNLNIYDKEVERKGDASYKDVLRLEVQLKRRFLKTELKSTGELPRLSNYFSESEREYYLKKLLENLVYTGDYYTFAECKKVLKQHYKELVVKKLLKLYKLIGLHGITKAFELNGTCIDTTKSYIKKLQNVGINSIPLDIGNTYYKDKSITTLSNLLNIGMEKYYEKH